MHTLTQESKYRDAIRFYQPLIARNANKLLGVTAIVLANLCVSYIMTSQVRCLVGVQQHPHSITGCQRRSSLCFVCWLVALAVHADSLGVKTMVLQDSS